MRVLEKPEHKR